MTMLRNTLVAFSSLSLFAAAGCNPSRPTPRHDVCSMASPPAGCRARCSDTVACNAGLYCSSGACTADCSAAHPCGSGFACSADGMCVEASGFDAGPDHDAYFMAVDANLDTTCASVEVGTTRSTPNVILIIDQSGSMGQEEFPAGSGVYRWDALESALMAQPNGLVFTLQSSVRWGMAFFRDTGFNCPNVASVPCALNNFATLDSTYRSLSPGGGTPTGESINQVLATRDTLISDPNQPTIFILATDGEPNTCADGADQAGGEAYSVGAVQNAFDLGIQTYVISVGSDVDTAHLQNLANAGTGTTGAMFWPATDTTSLSAALQSIVGGVVSCNLTLMGTIDPNQACSGTVTLNGTNLVCGDPNGWHAVDGNHIQLDGTACQMLLDGVTPLHAAFPCGVILI